MSLTSCSSNDAASAVEITCGNGFGNQDTEFASEAHPIWSPGWENGPWDASRAWIDVSDGTRWIQHKAETQVLAGTGGTVRVVSPDSARIIAVPLEVWASDANVLSLRSREVEFPSCDLTDAYPAAVLAAEPGCVTLKVTLESGEPYDVVVRMGTDIACG